MQTKSCRPAISSLSVLSIRFIQHKVKFFRENFGFVDQDFRELCRKMKLQHNMATEKVIIQVREERYSYSSSV